MINQIVITVRLNELKIYLQEIDKSEGSVDHISLIATYEIHKKIYEERISQDKADEIEQKINSLSLPVSNGEELTSDMIHLFVYPALGLINLNRLILGKPLMKYHTAKGDELKDLDRAYYFEKNFLFKQAIAQYDKALLNRNLSSTLEASILLRQGYCYALDGAEESAMNNYNIIISDYSYESSAITASILAKYLEGFSQARNRVLHGKSDPLLKSQKLVSLLAYEQALKIINTAELKSGSKDLPRILYFKARCYRGLGQPEKAVENYLKVITSNPDSPYAKFSNRKLFMIGASIGGDNAILETSKLINNRLEDPVLSRMIEDKRDAAVSGINTQNTINISVPESLRVKVGKMTAKSEPRKDMFLVILTGDGNTFKGKLIEQNAEYISLETSIGRIDVKKDKITKVIENR
jgi:tetratricopeptide (TPR) repeat protein